MFTPQFTLTNTIVNNLGTIERLYGLLLGEKLIPSLSLKLILENQILATHHSTSIEGNPLSQIAVTNLILGDQIPVTKSEKEVKNYFSVLNTISTLSKTRDFITTNLTTKLHKDLMEDIEKEDLGKFRDREIIVGYRTITKELVVKHNPPFHTSSLISAALEERYNWLQSDQNVHPLIRAGILHHQFVYIHPFIDGNGRLARLLTAYFLLLQNYEVTKYFILDDYYDIDRHQYSDMLHSADNADETTWLEYFLEGIAYSLQAALGRIDQLKNANVEKITGEKRVLVTHREEEVLQLIIEKKAIKTSDVQEHLNVTRQQAHQLLASLVLKGIIEKFGTTKASYYKLLDKSSHS